MTPIPPLFSSALIQKRVFEDVLMERDRQETLKAMGKFRYTCADRELLEPERLMVLVEGVGEVGRAILTASELTMDSRSPDLREELIQVMAVVLAWIEHLDRVKEAMKKRVEEPA